MYIKLFYQLGNFHSHQVRLLLLQKELVFEVGTHAPDDQLPEELAFHHHPHTLPAVLERDYLISGTPVLFEYLEDRYPFPPLLPSTPVERAAIRNLLYLFNQGVGQWLERLPRIEDNQIAEQVKKKIKTSLVNLNHLFFTTVTERYETNKMFMEDCSILPMLHQLQYYDIEVSAITCPGLHKYYQFKKQNPQFQVSLQEGESFLKPRTVLPTPAKRTRAVKKPSVNN